jgi:hypothetical protein
MEGERFGEIAVGLDPRDGRAGGPRAGLESLQQSSSESKAARPGRDPHALDLRGRAGVMLDRTAVDRLVVQAGDEELPGGRADLIGPCGHADCRVKRPARTAVELFGVTLQSEPRILVLRVGRDDLDHGDGQQAFNLAHRCDQPILLGSVQGLQQRHREFVRAGIERRALLLPERTSLAAPVRRESAVVSPSAWLSKSLRAVI